MGYFTHRTRRDLPVDHLDDVDRVSVNIIRCAGSVYCSADPTQEIFAKQGRPSYSSNPALLCQLISQHQQLGLLYVADA